MNILLIDDNPDIGPMIQKALEPYSLKHVYNIQAANEIINSTRVDLFLIDVTLPDGNGFDYCVELSARPEFEHIPKIFITGKVKTSEKILGLTSGADDYITKPFSLQELKARIDVQLRNQSAHKKIHRFDEFEFDITTQHCNIYYEDRKIELNLTPTEYKILYILAQKKGELVSREKLTRMNRKPHDSDSENRGIDTHVAHLRKKLGPARDKLISVYNRGYMLK